MQVSPAAADVFTGPDGLVDGHGLRGGRAGGAVVEVGVFHHDHRFRSGRQGRAGHDAGAFAGLENDVGGAPGADIGHHVQGPGRGEVCRVQGKTVYRGIVEKGKIGLGGNVTGQDTPRSAVERNGLGFDRRENCQDAFKGFRYA